MRLIYDSVAALLIASALASIAVPAHAADPCAAFKWDLSRERALFAGPAVPLTAGKDRASAPVVAPNRLYQLQLTAQDHVAFVTPPAKKMLAEGAYAGIAMLKVPVSGGYRVAVDNPFWIDVVLNGALVTAKNFQSQEGCSAPHKIVEFELAAAQPFVLQFSGAARGSVRLSVTQSPMQQP